MDTPRDAFSASDSSAHMHEEIHPNSHRNIIILDEEEEVEEVEEEEGGRRRRRRIIRKETHESTRSNHTKGSKTKTDECV